MTLGVCEACWLLEGNGSPADVTYCDTCGVWLCAACARAPWRRLRAAAIKGYGTLVG